MRGVKSFVFQKIVAHILVMNILACGRYMEKITRECVFNLMKVNLLMKTRI